MRGERLWAEDRMGSTLLSPGLEATSVAPLGLAPAEEEESHFPQILEQQQHLHECSSL